MQNGEKIVSLVQGLWPARAGAGGAGHDRQQGAGEHHDHVVAHDDGVRAADRGLRDQQPELHIRHPEGDQGMRDQHPDRGAGGKGGGLREHLRTKGRQVQGLWAHAGAASCVKAPLIDECYANLECKVVDGKMVAKYNLFILEVLKAWIDPARKDPQTIHHRGRGAFMVAGETIKLPSKMK